MQKQALEAKCVIVVLIVKWDFFLTFFCSSHIIHLIDSLITSCLIILKPPTHIKYQLQTFFSDIMFIKMKCVVAVSKQR